MQSDSYATARRRMAPLVAAATLLIACGTPEQNAWDLPREDVREIGRIVRAQTSSPIVSYTHDNGDPTTITCGLTRPMVTQTCIKRVEFADSGRLNTASWFFDRRRFRPKIDI